MQAVFRLKFSVAVTFLPHMPSYLLNWSLLSWSRGLYLLRSTNYDNSHYFLCISVESKYFLSCTLYAHFFRT